MSSPQWKAENKDKQAGYYKKWYQAHKEEQYQRNVERRKRNRDWINAHKETLKCETCGENHIAVLQFHHTDPSRKEGSLACAANDGWSIERIQTEISKCKVLCANCHFIFHWEEKTQS